MGALHRVPSQACSAVVVHSILDCLSSRTCPLFQCNAGVFVHCLAAIVSSVGLVMTLGRLIQFRLEGIHLGYFVAVLGVRAYSCLVSDAQNQTCHQHKRQESQGCGQIGKTQSQTDCQSRTRNWARTEPKQGKIFQFGNAWVHCRPNPRGLESKPYSRLRRPNTSNGTPPGFGTSVFCSGPFTALWNVAYAGRAGLSM